MADNVGYTPGTGATVAADDISGVLYQRVKLSLGADGSAVDAPGDGTFGLKVEVTNAINAEISAQGEAATIDVVSDAMSNLQSVLYTAARTQMYNGTTWDMVRGTTANGIDVDVTRVSGNVQIGDGTNSVTIDTAIADAEANAGNMLHTAARTMVFNGTTWDRQRGDITNGLDVDVTRLPSLVAGTAYVGKVRITDGTNDLNVDTAFNDGETATENHLDVAARLMAYNGTTFDIVRGSVNTFKCVTASTAQTGAAVWTPAAGKAVVITAMQIQSFGTTAGTAIVWFGGSADTTYTRGTDMPLFDGEFAPSTTNKPGVYMTYPTPIRGTADFVLRLTTTNAQSITVSVWGYEI